MARLYPSHVGVPSHHLAIDTHRAASPATWIRVNVWMHAQSAIATRIDSALDGSEGSLCPSAPRSFDTQPSTNTV